MACNFIKKRLQHRCFPVKFAIFLRISFFTEHLRWMLLTHLFLVKKESLEDSSEVVLTSLLEINALKVSKMCPAACNHSQICTLVKQPKDVPATYSY